MINQMNQIYANAAITIIAAGEDAQMGLPGVSTCFRRPQRQVNVGQDTVIFELPLSYEEVDSSKWASRSWTYQEGYLSTRRLIFTSTQVLFLCNRMYAAESVQLLLDQTCSTDADRFKHLIPVSIPGRRGFHVDDLLDQVIEYSKRELSYSSDSLNAFLGVLKYYTQNSAKLTYPVLCLPWGLIVQKKACEDTDNNVCGVYLLWSHEKSILTTRRPGFPSWAWTGWGGPLSARRVDPSIGTDMVLLYPKKHGNTHGLLPHLDYGWRLYMEDEDRQVVHVYDCAQKELMGSPDQRLYRPISKRLWITSMVISVCFMEFKLTRYQKENGTEISFNGTCVPRYFPRTSSYNRADGVYPVLQVWKGIYATFPAESMDQQVGPGHRILGLLRKKTPDDSGILWAYSHCLLVQQVGDGLYERVGMLQSSELVAQKTRNTVFLDTAHNILDKFNVTLEESDDRNGAIGKFAERRTICLI